MTLKIRPETNCDEAVVRRVNVAAFPTPREADLVDALRAAGDNRISLVAEDGGKVIGHVMLSRMSVVGDRRQYRALGLAPVAVFPDRQGQGIGSALIQAALSQARKCSEQIVFVVGEPNYYRRFGFDAATAAPFASPYAGQYFQAKVLVDDFRPPASGRADYAPAFADLEP